MKIPEQITQGDTIVWRDVSTRDNLGNQISAPDWSLTYYFNGPTRFNVTAETNVDGWQTTLTSAQTSAMTPVHHADTPANYYWQATATKDGISITIGSGMMVVKQNLATAPASFDGRSKAELDLAAVQQAISARINGGLVHEYTIGTRRLRNEPMSELLALESRLKLIISKERQAQALANGLGDPRNTYVRFS